MAQLDNLYREIIMEHFKNPRNKGLLTDGPYRKYRFKNPSCGDDITIQTKTEANRVSDCRHEGSGCSICCASASILTEMMIGRDVDEAKTIAETFVAMVKNEPYDETIDLGEAEAFQGVRMFPARTKCATIAWLAFLETIKPEGDTNE
ncbi:MAG: SUF system NifU family Fe-S cluster assembly protein [Candidatus Izemoplasmatales bacterium]|nr:SUF system NifU family Fe-S cluster assembly protein [Candidatus Izemoplasmatales bacterium]